MKPYTPEEILSVWLCGYSGREPLRASINHQYREYGKPTFLPPSALEHPWVLIRGASGRIAYLTHKQNGIGIGIVLLLSKDHWKPKGKYPQYCLIFDADVLHVFPCEPDQKSINAARRQLRRRP